MNDLSCFDTLVAEKNRVGNWLHAFTNLNDTCKLHMFNSIDNTNLKLILFAYLKFIISNKKLIKKKKSSFEIYKDLCKKETEKNTFYLENIELRGWDTYHVDHIVPIHYGYKNKISPKLIGSFENLQILPAVVNRLKSDILTEKSLSILDLWKRSKKL